MVDVCIYSKLMRRRARDTPEFIPCISTSSDCEFFSKIQRKEELEINETFPDEETEDEDDKADADALCRRY